MNNIKTINFKEHDSVFKDTEDVLALNELIQNESLNLPGMPDDFMGVPKYLGISEEGEKFTAGYYIGVTWFKENQVAGFVEPKIPNVDFIQMFSQALLVDSDKESNYFSKCYGIDFKQSPVQIDSSVNVITPLILLHYISLLNKLVKHGLKKGYVHREQNLQSKVKGRILFQKNYRINKITKRDDRVYCGFNEYTVDIPENRLLKRALLFTEKAISRSVIRNKKDLYEDLRIKINKIKAYFNEVSEDIEISEVQSISANKLFAGYKDALRVAKMILRNFGYSVNNIGHNDKSTYPFWIDMPRLYELYVYGVLRNCFGSQVEFQVEGYYGSAADYIIKNQKIILDAKYKPHYEYSNGGILDDIREMSGYARDQKILKHFDNPENEIPCVIIYPSKIDNETDSFIESKLVPGMNIVQNATPIRAFRNFYKIKIEVPIMNN